MKLFYPWNTCQNKHNKDEYKWGNKVFVYWPILGCYNNWKIIYCIESRKQQESIDTDVYVHIKYNAGKNIALNIGKDISDNNYGEASTIDKNVENEYYLVKWTGGSYS